MDGISKSAISEESVAEAAEFVAEFSHELQGYAARLTGTPQETACARAIRVRLEQETGVPVRMEAFKAKPSLGRGSFYLLGVWFLLSYAIYYVSFVGGRLAGILIALVALLNFVAGGVVIMLLFLGEKKLSALLGNAISYNVVSEVSKSREHSSKQRVIVVADCHDAENGSILRDYGLIRRLTALLCPISAFVFVLFCVLKMAIGTSAPNASVKISVFTVVPAVLGVIGIVATLLHYSPFAKHAKTPNGISTCVAMATYAYFAEQPELIPDDVRMVYASFGAENSAHGGAEAFVKAHPEFAGADVLCFGEIKGAQFKIAEYDPVGRLSYSAQMVSALSGAARELGDDVSLVPHGTIAQGVRQIHGYPSSAFARAGVQSATLLSDGEIVDDSVVGRLFLLSASVVLKLFKEMPAPKADSIETPASTDAQMRPISSK